MMDAPTETLAYAGWKDGEVIDIDPVRGVRRVYRDIDDKHGAIVTEYLYAPELLAANAEDRAAQAGTGWGDGKVVGRIPFNLLIDPNAGIIDAVRAKDDAYLRRFLEQNPAFKTRDKI